MPQKTKANPSTKAPTPEQVDTFMRALQHTLKNVVEELRAIILSAHSAIGEEIKWNAPAFFYTGAMPEFDPKLHKRHIVVFNLFKKDSARLVFLSGARIGDSSGLLTGNYSDGRRLAEFSGMEQVQSRKASLKAAIRKWIATIDKE